MSRKVAVVTGSNKGIGLAIVEGLCEHFKGDVYLTSRDRGRGEGALEELKKRGYHPLYHQLDVTDVNSIKSFRDHLKNNYGGLDLLINNAAITFPSNSTETFAFRAKETMFVNYFSLVSTCDILFPLLRQGARVVHLSSSSGRLARIPGADIKNKLAKCQTESELTELAKRFVESAENGRYVEEGWGESPYVVSKVAVTALTKIQASRYSPGGVSVNCVHPGWVSTDMTQHKGPLSPSQGARAPLYLALEAPHTLQGVYMWHDKQIVDWTGEAPID